MLGLFSRKKSFIQSGLLKDAVDNHSHILPGVDDGVRTLDESLEILAFLDGSSDELKLHPTMKGGAIVDIYYQKNDPGAIARYFEYSEFASGTEYTLQEITPDQMKILESYIP